MLSKLFSNSVCKECGFCCIFKVCHLWETPLFSAEDIKKLKNYKFNKIEDSKNVFFSFLSKNDFRKQPEDEIVCPFLNIETGCTLDKKIKPFECKIWPYRIMKKDGKTILAISKECPAISKYDMENLKDFARNNLLNEIKNFIKTHPFAVKEYRDNYYELFEL